jgi:hypothetical protein
MSTTHRKNRDMSFIRSLFDNIGKAIGWVADKVTQGLTWTKKVIVDGARWLWDKVKGGASMAKDLAVRSVGWFKNLFVNAKGILIGAWNLTAPFRTWVATPFRLAATASATVGAAWIFSPWFLLVVGGIWIGYLLITSFNNEKETRTKKVPTKTDPVSGEQVREWTRAQFLAIQSHEMQVSMKANSIKNKTTDRVKSEYAARIWLLEMRRRGSLDSLTALYKQFRKQEEENNRRAKENGEDQLGWVWTAVEKAIRDEQKVLDDILDKVVEPEPEPEDRTHVPDLDLQPV